MFGSRSYGVGLSQVIDHIKLLEHLLTTVLYSPLTADKTFDLDFVLSRSDGWDP